ncbi:MAG: hypothetical protein QNJ97_08630 [Myxococcota bacterium]|nr:hypothetical protein [Myxococcota bacterium]
MKAFIRWIIAIAVGLLPLAQSMHATADAKERDQATAERDLDAFKGIVELAFGYTHPAGEISNRFGPGIFIGTAVLVKWQWIAIGAGINLAKLGGVEVIAALPEAGEDEPEGETREQAYPDTIGIGIELPVVAKILLWDHDPWLLWLDLSAGPRFERLDLEDATEGIDPDEFNRARFGIGLEQGLSFGYLFALKGSGAPDDADKMGVYLKVGVRESWTWNVEEVRKDLGQEDLQHFGTGWWPFVLIGWNGYY